MTYCGGMLAIRAALGRNRGQLSVLFLVLCLALGGSSACGNETEGTGGTILLWVTQDYGHEEIFAGAVEVEPGQSVLTLLQEHLAVETAYGGRFVSSIAGMAAGEERDWFFSVNGVTAHIGAHAYRPGDGDVIWWDYRPWGGDNPFTPAVVGAWPEPFVNGYQGRQPDSYVLYGEDAKHLAAAVADALKSWGASPVKLQEYAEDLVKQRQGPTLVVALWPELTESEFWQGIDENWARTGWVARLTEKAFYPMRPDATHAKEGFTGSVGAILTTATGLGDPSPLWLVTALDSGGLEQAVRVLLERPETLRQTLGILVVKGETVVLPVR